MKCTFGQFGGHNNMAAIQKLYFDSLAHIFMAYGRIRGQIKKFRNDAALIKVATYTLLGSNQFSTENTPCSFKILKYSFSDYTTKIISNILPKYSFSVYKAIKNQLIWAFLKNLGCAKMFEGVEGRIDFNAPFQTSILRYTYSIPANTSQTRVLRAKKYIYSLHVLKT